MPGPGTRPIRALLKKELGMYLDRVRPSDLEGELTGLVVPHAGYIYSGSVAAWSYKLLLNSRFDRVLILAPSHQASFAGASIYNLGGYRTPLGIVPLDLELIDELYKNTAIIHYVPQADSREHSLEIQLPFLQIVLDSFSLTPVIMGTQRYDFCLKLAEAIAQACSNKRVLIIASSDLSHYYPYEKAMLLDGVCLERLNCFDPQGLAAEVENQRTQACGAGPLITLMLAAKNFGGATFGTGQIEKFFFHLVTGGKTEEYLLERKTRINFFPFRLPLTNISSFCFLFRRTRFGASKI